MWWNKPEPPQEREEIKTSSISWHARSRHHMEAVATRPHCPEWYPHEWSVVHAGKGHDGYYVLCDGLPVRDGSVYGFHIPYTFYSEDTARCSMYALIDEDIRCEQYKRRAGEVIETWP